MEVVCIKKILAKNLLIFIGLHCVRRSSWTVTTLATLSRWCAVCKLDTIQDFRSKLGMKLWINWISRNNLSLTINLVRSTNIIKDLFHFFFQLKLRLSILTQKTFFKAVQCKPQQKLRKKVNKNFSWIWLFNQLSFVSAFLDCVACCCSYSITRRQNSSKNARLWFHRPKLC